MSHEFDLIMASWMNRYARKNLWRVIHVCDLDDLVQEGHVIFAKCNARYGHVQERRHFMALFQRMFTNTIHDLARDGYVRVGPGHQPVILGEYTGYSFNEGPLRVALKELSASARLVLALFDTPDGRQRLQTGIHKRRFGGARETTSAFLCRVAGIPFVEVEREIRDALGGNSVTPCHAIPQVAGGDVDAN